MLVNIHNMEKFHNDLIYACTKLSQAIDTAIKRGIRTIEIEIFQEQYRAICDGIISSNAAVRAVIRNLRKKIIRITPQQRLMVG